MNSNPHYHGASLHSCGAGEKPDCILVVDDDPVDLEIIMTVLEQPGRSLYGASSGEEALTFLRQRQDIGLILLDVQMPLIDGFKTARYIRNRLKLSDVPILFLTATYSDDEFIKQGFGVGAQDYLSKPINAELLNNKVNLFLRLYRQQQALLLELHHRQQTEQALRLNSTVFEYTPEPVMITDAEKRILRVNRAFCDSTGFSTEECLGKTPDLLRSGRHDLAFYQAMWKSLTDKGRWSGELWNRRRDGSIYPEWATIVAVPDDDDQILNYVAIYSDFSGHDRLQDRLHKLAFYDNLTGLPNRELVLEYLTGQIEFQQKPIPMAVMYLQLDQFQLTNEVLGTQVGDQLLCQVGELLRQEIPIDAYLARPGGDTFLVVLPHLWVTEDAARFAQQVLSRFEEAFRVHDQGVNLNAHIGISLYPDDADQPSALLTHAKTAVSRARQHSSGQFQFYTSAMNTFCHDRMFLEAELHRALSRNELRLAYQPQIDLKSGEIIGFEALARWQHPQQGAIGPDRFIPVAEESGLITKLGDWALRTACQQAALWNMESNRPLRMAVNVSATQLQQGRLSKTVAEILQQTGFDASLLELEITESTLMASINQAELYLSELQKLGIQLSIDDFGTGYSSLSYLSRLQIHRLKIDRSFIDPLPHDKHARTLVEAILAMGHGLNLMVIAEGIETQAHQDYLLQLGCDEAQGYFISKPLFADEMTAFIRHYTQGLSHE